LRILDMTQYEAGTSCTQALAWLGADVVKVEAPDHGDPGRASGLSAGYSPYFCAWNANKKSVAIDLRTDAGKDLFLRLLPGFDIVVENFAPGVVEKLGLGYHALRSVHPTVIHGQIKGFGNSGPQSHYKSFDAVAQAAAGAFSLTGEADGPPLYPGTTIGDSGTGVQMAMALLAAYVQRLRTGEGQHIEISMQEAVTYYVRTRNAFAGEWGAKAAPRNGTKWVFHPSGFTPAVLAAPTTGYSSSQQRPNSGMRCASSRTIPKYSWMNDLSNHCRGLNTKKRFLRFCQHGRSRKPSSKP